MYKRVTDGLEVVRLDIGLYRIRLAKPEPDSATFFLERMPNNTWELDVDVPNATGPVEVFPTRRKAMQWLRDEHNGKHSD